MGGIAEHDALIPCALGITRILGSAGAGFQGVEHSLSDLSGLLADGDIDSDSFAVETIGRGIVADADQGIANQSRDLYLAGGGHLTGNLRQTGCGQRFHSNSRVGVHSQ
ncbi:hypothetical protein GCM10011401_26800 [Nesterenkonia cremea]|uniref:Uncharacterized protein n=1 Tax=Nesterenkonia cremea TaxID=1882340 RepID=A0A917ETF4_9MICC|nr:hypothetical protein GCM10011401_26800 [Nesterenkonia cremea]